MGTDAPSAGLSDLQPCKTINFGIERAIEENLNCLFVQTGNYNEVVIMADGISLIGGYDSSWVFDLHTNAGHNTTITGAFNNGLEQYVAIVAHDLFQTTSISNLSIMAPDAYGVINGAGRSSYGVHVFNCTDFSLSDLRVTGGGGATGDNGDDGLGASPNPANAGASGLDGFEGIFSCGTVTYGGGSSGTGVNSNSGGNGGRGGAMDTDCDFFNPNYNATQGVAGLQGSSNSGTGNGGSSGFGGSVCASPGNGGDGGEQNGLGGSGGNSQGSLSNGFWYSGNGLDGTLGKHGGGGGGGGAGGCDTGTDERGASGGGGGAGGVGAASVGTRGHGGGGSFGFLIIDSDVVVTNCQFIRGAAGRGGRGGDGALGQPGGAGGWGGATAADSGPGGDGGDGGDSGAGGGGGGGSSVGISSFNSLVSVVGTTYIGGSIGTGGPGGSGSSGQTEGVGGNDGFLHGFLPGLLNRASSQTTRAPNKAICDNTPCLLSPVDELPVFTFELQNNVPNPFNPNTDIRFSLPAALPVRLTIHDLSGRVVRTLSAGESYSAGQNSIPWSGRDDFGRQVPSGSYLVKLEAGADRSFQKIMLLK